MSGEEIESKVVVRFLAKIAPLENGCWIWTGEIAWNGYGAVTVHGKRDSAHSWAYRIFVGGIPEGLELDHLCRNRACVNPDHLEAVTRSENQRRGWASIGAQRRERIRAKITTCSKGHPFSQENTQWIRPSRQGPARRCRTCHKAYMSEYNKRIRKVA